MNKRMVPSPLKAIESVLVEPSNRLVETGSEEVVFAVGACDGLEVVNTIGAFNLIA